AGPSDTFNLGVGFNAVGDEPAASGALGAVTITGEEIVHITSRGVNGNSTFLVTLTPSLAGNEQVTIDGTKNIAFSNFQNGAIQDVVSGALNPNNMIITITDTGVVTFNGSLQVTTPLHFTPVGDSTDLVFSTNAVAIDASKSGGLIMTAGDANYTSSTTVAGSAGDNIIGSTTAGNVLGGAIGDSARTANNNAGRTIYTHEGAAIRNVGASPQN